VDERVAWDAYLSTGHHVEGNATLPLSIKANEIHYAHPQHVCIQFYSLLITKVSFVSLIDNDALAVHNPVARYNVIVLWVMEVQVGGEFGLKGTRES
jgi:hypothetical protein